VTGVAGFIGSNLLEQLLKLDLPDIAEDMKKILGQ